MDPLLYVIDKFITFICGSSCLVFSCFVMFRVMLPAPRCCRAPMLEPRPWKCSMFKAVRYAETNGVRYFIWCLCGGRSILTLLLSEKCLVFVLLHIYFLYPYYIVYKFETETITGLITFWHSLPPPYIRVAIHE